MIFRNVKKGIVNGVATSGIGLILLGNPTIDLPYISPNTPLWAVAGGIAFVGSMLADEVHQYILPEIPLVNKFEDLASLLIGGGITGTTMYGGLSIINSELASEIGIPIALTMGIGGEILGSYSINMFDKYI